VQRDREAGGLGEPPREVPGPPRDRALLPVPAEGLPDDDPSDLPLPGGPGDLAGRLGVARPRDRPDGEDDLAALVRDRNPDPALAEIDREDAHRGMVAAGPRRVAPRSPPAATMGFRPRRPAGRVLNGARTA
jgi:hypothetical protein